MRVGLVGYSCPTGLGYENRRMWQKMPLDRWLLIPHPTHGLDISGLRSGRMFIARSHLDVQYVDEFLDGLDTVVCVERTFPEDLFRKARERGVRCVLLANVEWFHSKKRWFHDADVVVARNRFGERHLGEQPILKGKVVFSPAPLDLDELPYQLRRRASKVVFSNGWGGVHNRKGWVEVRTVLVTDPKLITVRSQKPLPDAPPGVTVLGAVDRPADLFRGFDLAVQPSQFEGLGLSILEAMACGVPVLTTNAPPMNEYVRAAYGGYADKFLLPVKEVQRVTIWGPWDAHVVNPDGMKRKIEALRGTDVSAFSRLGRSYTRDVHGPSAWDKLWALLTG